MAIWLVPPQAIVLVHSLLCLCQISPQSVPSSSSPVTPSSFELFSLHLSRHLSRRTLSHLSPSWLQCLFTLCVAVLLCCEYSHKWTKFPPGQGACAVGIFPAYSTWFPAWPTSGPLVLATVPMRITPLRPQPLRLEGSRNLLPVPRMDAWSHQPTKLSSEVYDGVDERSSFCATTANREDESSLEVLGAQCRVQV